MSGAQIVQAVWLLLRTWHTPAAWTWGMSTVSRDPRPAARITVLVHCDLTARRWACGFLRHAAGSLPQSWHAAHAFHVPGVHWDAGSGVPSTHWPVGTAELIHPLEHRWPQSTCAGSSRQLQPTCSNHRKESKSQFGLISKGSREEWSSLNLSSTVWAERTAHFRWGHGGTSSQAVLSPFSFLLFCDETAATARAAQHELCRRPLSPPPLSPPSWAFFSKSTRISENRAAIRPLRPGSVLPCAGH